MSPPQLTSKPRRPVRTRGCELHKRVGPCSGGVRTPWCERVYPSSSFWPCIRALTYGSTHRHQAKGFYGRRFALVASVRSDLGIPGKGRTLLGWRNSVGPFPERTSSPHPSRNGSIQRWGQQICPYTTGTGSFRGCPARFQNSDPYTSPLLDADGS